MHYMASEETGAAVFTRRGTVIAQNGCVKAREIQGKTSPPEITEQQLDPRIGPIRIEEYFSENQYARYSLSYVPIISEGCVVEARETITFKSNSLTNGKTISWRKAGGVYGKRIVHISAPPSPELKSALAALAGSMTTASKNIPKIAIPTGATRTIAGLECKEYEWQDGSGRSACYATVSNPRPLIPNGHRDYDNFPLFIKMAPKGEDDASLGIHTQAIEVDLSIPLDSSKFDPEAL